MKPFQLTDKETGELRFGGQWLVKYRAPDGTWRRHIGGATFKEAEASLRGILVDMERGQWVDPREERQEAKEAVDGPQTWGEIVKKFSKVNYNLPGQKNSRKCLQYTIQFLEKGLEDSGSLLPATTPINKLTKRTLRTVYDSMAALKTLSPRTKNLKLTYLKVVLKWAVEHPGIPLNEDPSQGLKRFRTEGSSSQDDDQVKPDEVFSLSEVQAILAYAKESMGAANAAMLETAFATGLRRGELIGMKWRDIDFDQSLLTVCRNYDRKPKSGKSRIVPIESTLKTTLKVWKAQSPYSKKDHHVFPTPDGEMRSETFHWAYLVKRAAKGAKVLRPELSRFGHLTRHTFATLYLRAGGSDILLAKILGHADTRLVHRVYSHFCANDLQSDMMRCGFSLKSSSASNTPEEHKQTVSQIH